MCIQSAPLDLLYVYINKVLGIRERDRYSEKNDIQRPMFSFSICLSVNRPTSRKKIVIWLSRIVHKKINSEIFLTDNILFFSNLTFLIETCERIFTYTKTTQMPYCEKYMYSLPEHLPLMVFVLLGLGISILGMMFCRILFDFS